MLTMGSYVLLFLFLVFLTNVEKIEKDESES